MWRIQKENVTTDDPKKDIKEDSETNEAEETEEMDQADASTAYTVTQEGIESFNESIIDWFLNQTEY